MRERPHEEGISHAEHGRGGTDTQRDGQQHDRRPPWGTAKSAEGVTQVLPERIKPTPAPHVLARLQGCPEIPECPAAGVRSGLRAHSGPSLSLRAQCLVEAHLLLELLAEVVPTEEKDQAPPQLSRGHIRLG